MIEDQMELENPLLKCEAIENETMLSLDEGTQENTSQTDNSVHDSDLIASCNVNSEDCPNKEKQDMTVIFNERMKLDHSYTELLQEAMFVNFNNSHLENDSNVHCMKQRLRTKSFSRNEKNTTAANIEKRGKCNNSKKTVTMQIQKKNITIQHTRPMNIRTDIANNMQQIKNKRGRKQRNNLFKLFNMLVDVVIKPGFYQLTRPRATRIQILRRSVTTIEGLEEKEEMLVKLKKELQLEALARQKIVAFLNKRRCFK